MDGNSKNKGFDSYWQNYEQMVGWMNNGNLSQWKAKVRALEVENALLRDFIKKQFGGNGCTVDLPSPARASTARDDTNQTNQTNMWREEEVEDDGFDSDSDISEELLAFYEQTVKHRLEHRKHVAEERRKQEEEDLQISKRNELCSMSSLRSAHRSEDMNTLYGDAAAKIFSMELSMQINFDTNRIKSNAPMWPNIPLRLSNQNI